jgi:hypothetical protein
MTSKEIIKSYRQGGTGNCVSIAVIKASIQVFGLDKVVYFQKTTNEGYSFTMRDGFESSITKQEVELAIKGSNFICKVNKDIFNYSNLCFAAMAKRALDDKHEGSKTYKGAIESLNNGEYYYLGADWLGLRHHKRAIGLRFIWNNIGVVGASPKHCFFCSEGIVDKYGTPDPINWLEKIKYAFFSYYRIASESAY